MYRATLDFRLHLSLTVASSTQYDLTAEDTVFYNVDGQRSGVPPAESTRHLFQRLSVCLWRGNATMWLERLPSHSAWVDGIIQWSGQRA